MPSSSLRSKPGKSYKEIDYYPFGMVMPGRKFSAGSLYRYGFNGKENDNEVKGEGNQQDYGMRIYDPRVGRFLSVDPLTIKYPELTSYQFSSNRPIDGIDIDGLEFVKSDSRTSLGLIYDPTLKQITAGTVMISADNPNVPDWLKEKIINYQASLPCQSSACLISKQSMEIGTIKAAESMVPDPSGDLADDIRKLKKLAPSVSGTETVKIGTNNDNVPRSKAQKVIDVMPGPSVGGINTDRLAKANTILAVVGWVSKAVDVIGKGLVTDAILNEAKNAPGVFSLIQRSINNEFSSVKIPDEFLNGSSLEDLANYIYNGKKILDYSLDVTGNEVVKENTKLMKIGDALLKQKASEDGNSLRKAGKQYKDKPAIDQTDKRNF